MQLLQAWNAKLWLEVNDSKICQKAWRFLFCFDSVEDIQLCIDFKLEDRNIF